MFRNQGRTKNFSYNLRIASLLSFVAGMVNVVGFFAVSRLVTNVTGHFAFFVYNIFNYYFWEGFVYFLYIFFFFLGSLVSNLLIEIISKKDVRYIYVVPASIECLLLFAVGFWGHYMLIESPNIIAFILLFAMGLQNSLVTTISYASVRTTHLTGLFTDLGIEISQLFFYKSIEQQVKLRSSIKLRLTIISCFFAGGMVGGILYAKVELQTLAFAAFVLALGISYTYIKFKFIFLMRRRL